MPSGNLFNQIRQVVRKIPKGKVSTYGDIAKIVGINDARKVGWAMAGTADLSIPCHRVVKKEGKLSEKFGFGGWKEQRDRLEEEGIIFEGEGRKVDMRKYRWIFD